MHIFVLSIARKGLSGRSTVFCSPFIGRKESGGRNKADV